MQMKTTVISCRNDLTIESITRADQLGHGYKPNGALWFSVDRVYLDKLRSVGIDETLFGNFYYIDINKFSVVPRLDSVLVVATTRDYNDFYACFWRVATESIDWDSVAGCCAGVFFSEPPTQAAERRAIYDHNRRATIGGYIWDNSVVSRLELVDGFV